MRFTENVTGTMANRPLEFEENGDQIYSRWNISKETVEEGEGDAKTSRTQWAYSELMLERDEYNQIVAGMLPSSCAEWTAPLRRLERRCIYNSIDELVSKADRKIALGVKADEWSSFRTAALQWKEDVEATKSQAGYPAEVSYPDFPEVPE